MAGRGGKIIAAALDAGLIDDVIVSIHPLLLGGGIPLAAPPAARTSLALVGERCYPSALVQVSYRADRN